MGQVDDPLLTPTGCAFGRWLVLACVGTEATQTLRLRGARFPAVDATHRHHKSFFVRKSLLAKTAEAWSTLGHESGMKALLLKIAGRRGGAPG